MKDSIEFQGVIYNRYPEAKGWAAKWYFIAQYSGRKKGFSYLHRDVWISIYGSIPDGMQIHHKDDNPLNNSIENLECLTMSEHRKRHRTFSKCSEAGKKAWKVWKKSQAICTCCGKSYEVYRKTQSRFCSDKCVTKNRFTSGVDNIERECIECKKKFKCNRYKPRQTCSRVCADNLSKKTKAQRRLI